MGPDQDVVLPTPVPVYLTYMTARPEGGTIAYEPDPYRLDRAGGSKMVSARRNRAGGASPDTGRGTK